MSFSTLNQAIWPVLDAARQAGVPLGEILARAGYAEEQLRRPGERIPRNALAIILRGIEPWIASPARGFETAALVSPEVFDTVEYAARAASTLRAALETVNRYAPIVDDSADFRLEPLDAAEQGVVLWRLQTEFPSDLRPVLLQYLFGLLDVCGSRVMGEPVPTEEIWLAHPEPASVECYYDYFEARVRFDAPCDGALFRSEVLDRPTAAADPALASLLRRTADSELARMWRSDSLAKEVARIVQGELASGEPDLLLVARRLGTSGDNLRKRLHAEGTNYRTILTEARLDAARSHLARATLSLAEVSDRLAFRNPTSFFRWFKQQTGETPSEYRRRCQQAG